MGDLEAKKDHVRKAKQTRNHRCHWPGCDKEVAPAKWGCYPHWMKLPKWLRDKIWMAYAIGQEVSLTPSRDYLAVAREAQDWIKEHHPNG